MLCYETYCFSRKEWFGYLLQGIVFTSVLAYLFYDRAIAFVLLSPLQILLFKWRKTQLKKQRLEVLNLQFKEALLSVNAAMQTGYSLENAWREASREMQLLFGERSIICQELQHMIFRLEMNENIEAILEDFAKRTQLEDILMFSEIVSFAKRSGGNFVKIIQRTVSQMGEKIEVDRQIQTLTAAKRMEQKIMNVMPMAIILYLRVGSPGYLDVMYKNPIGIIIMTVCLIGYGGAWYMGTKMIQITI